MDKEKIISELDSIKEHLKSIEDLLKINDNSEKVIIKERPDSDFENLQWIEPDDDIGFEDDILFEGDILDDNNI